MFKKLLKIIANKIDNLLFGFIPPPSDDLRLRGTIVNHPPQGFRGRPSITVPANPIAKIHPKFEKLYEELKYHLAFSYKEQVCTETTSKSYFIQATEKALQEFTQNHKIRTFDFYLDETPNSFNLLVKLPNPDPSARTSHRFSFCLPLLELVPNINFTEDDLNPEDTFFNSY